MAGMFDDLIPGNRSAASISFDDLIPKKSGQHLSYEEGLALLEEEERRQRMQGGSGSFGAAVSSTIDGVPVVGPILKGGAERAAAGISSLLNGQPYGDNLREAQALTQTAEEEHPYITTAGNVAGAVGGSIPMVMAAPGALGASGASILARTGASTLSGGLIGAADAGVRSGGDPDAMQTGAMWGIGTGAVAPVAGALIGRGVRSVADLFRNTQAAKAAGTSNYALSRLNRALTDDGLDAAAAGARLQALGPDAMIADLGPNLQGQVAALANMPGDANTIVRNALNARHAGANARLASTIDDTLGRAVVPSTVDDVIASAQREIGRRYGEVFQNARAVDTTRIAKGLESKAINLRGDAQKAVQRVRFMLNITGTDMLDPHPGTLFQTRQAIDGMMASETNPKVIQALTEVRGQVDDVLARAVPGLKEVDGQFAELARQRESLQRGQTVLDGGRTAPRPTELAQEAADGALPQGTFVGPSGGTARMRQGARAEIDRILGNNANDIARLNTLIKSDGDWNRARLATLFGRDKADRLFSVLENELAFANTRNFALGNSATAGRQQAIRELGGRADPAFGVRDAYAAGGFPGVVRSAGVKAADKLLGSLASSGRNSRNAALADAITSNREALIRALAERGMPQSTPKGLEQVIRALLLSGATTGAR